MHLNWGNKLLLVFAAFGIMMSYLVYRCMHTSYDLVSKDYYKEELTYQQVIDDAGRAGKLSQAIQMEQWKDNIQVCFPPEMKQTVISGTIYFYCAANAARDKKVSINTNVLAIQNISRRALLPGPYTVKINWESNSKQYYSEQYLLVR